MFVFYVCFSSRCLAGETPRNGHTGRLVGSRFSPDTALDDDPSWWCWVPRSGQLGEESDERTRPLDGDRLGGMLRHAPLRAIRGVECGSWAGHFKCPAVSVLMTMTNVRTPRVGGSGWRSPGGLGQDSSQGLPRRRASARLQAVPLM